MHRCWPRFSQEPHPHSIPVCRIYAVDNWEQGIEEALGGQGTSRGIASYRLYSFGLIPYTMVKDEAG